MGPESEGRQPGRVWNSTSSVWNGLVTLFIAVGLGIYGVLTPYDYWVGTPAKAKVEHCERHGISSPDSSPDLDCTGTWAVRGQSQGGDDQATIPRRRTKRERASTLASSSGSA